MNDETSENALGTGDNRLNSDVYGILYFIVLFGCLLLMMAVM